VRPNVVLFADTASCISVPAEGRDVYCSTCELAADSVRLEHQHTLTVLVSLLTVLKCIHQPHKPGCVAWQQECACEWWPPRYVPYRRPCIWHNSVPLYSFRLSSHSSCLPFHCLLNPMDRQFINPVPYLYPLRWQKLPGQQWQAVQMNCCSQWRLLIGHGAYGTVWRSWSAQSVSTVSVSSSVHTEHICSVPQLQWHSDWTVALYLVRTPAGAHFEPVMFGVFRWWKTTGG